MFDCCIILPGVGADVVFVGVFIFRQASTAGLRAGAKARRLTEVLGMASATPAKLDVNDSVPGTSKNCRV
jgi:hypothetical protein